MKRKKPTVADWQAHLPEWMAAGKMAKRANRHRNRLIEKLEYVLDIRDSLLDGERTPAVIDTIRELEPVIDKLCERIVAASTRMKRACKRGNDIADKYAYWRNV